MSDKFPWNKLDAHNREQQEIESDGPPCIEVFRTVQFYIFVQEKFSLWWDRRTGEFTAKTDWDWASAIEPECLGLCFGIIGKIYLDLVLEPRLILIKEYSNVGEYIDGKPIYKVKSITFLQQEDNANLNLFACEKHRILPFSKKGTLFDQKSTFAKTLGAVRNATHSLKTSTKQAAALAIPQVKFKFVSKDKEKFEKRILEELHKIFTGI